NDGEPLTIAGHRDVRRRARQGYGLVEHAALSVAEKCGDGLARGVPRIPCAPRPFSHPTGGVGGERWCGTGDGKNRPAFVNNGKAVDTVGRGKSQDISPKRGSKRSVVRHAGERYSSARPGERPMLRERQLQNRTRLEGDTRPALAYRDLASRSVGEVGHATINIALGPHMTFGTIRAHHKEMFLGEGDRIRVHTALRQFYGAPYGDEVVIPHQSSDSI